MRKLLSLWGRGAAAEDDKPQETDEEKAAREKAEKDANDKAQADDQGDELEEGEDDEATKAAAAAVPANVRASIVRGERQRIHAIVDGAGRDQVEAALHVAFNTELSAKAALGLVKATAGTVAPATAPAGGRLGLAADMATRRPSQIGIAGDTAGGAKSEEETAVAAILKHAAKPAA